MVIGCLKSELWLEDCLRREMNEGLDERRGMEETCFPRIPNSKLDSDFDSTIEDYVLKCLPVQFSRVYSSTGTTDDLFSKALKALTVDGFSRLEEVLKITRLVNYSQLC